MIKIFTFLVATLMVATLASNAFAQEPSPAQMAEAEKTFNTANEFQEQRKFHEALTHYKRALAILPNEPAILFNGGMAAFATKNYSDAADMWKKLKTVDPTDWHARAKLIQVYQALNKTAERDAERTELFAMWKKGEPAELKKEFEYCRDQFEVNGKQVMAFEHFELKGERALRYVFSILDETGEAEEFRISLGSYDFTNAVWREQRNPKPKKDERLFHLDGYFKGGGHVTYDMYFPEPTYDQVRVTVVQILEGRGKAKSSSTPATPASSAPTPKP